MDVRDFRFPSNPLVVYLFNPFARSTFAATIENLHRSWQQSPRDIYLVYRSPEFEELLKGMDWMEAIDRTEQWTLYRARPQQP